MASEEYRIDRRGFIHFGAAASLAAIGGALGNSVRAQEANTTLQVRRVVTGHDENGRSRVDIDEALDVSSGREGLERGPVWSTGSFPVNNSGSGQGAGDDRAAAAPDANSTVFRVVQYAPGVAPRVHRTQTIDYAVVISGEIDMELDHGEVRLRQGDVLVQRGTIHNWINRGTEPCVIAFILIAAESVEAGGMTLRATG